MKKGLLIIIPVILITLGIFLFRIDKNEKVLKKEEVSKVEEKNPVIDQENIIDSYKDDNPIKLGLYKYYGKDKNRELITEYSSTWTYHNDISSFEVYYTNESSIPSTSQKELFDQYRANYTNCENYKIGYIINFKCQDQEINKTILSPNDTLEFFDYLEIYLYDDYHRNGEWYSHTTEEEFNDNTILTSIKLTAGKNVSEITSPIKLSAFTYDGDDLDNNNQYIGQSIYTITVNNI